MVERTSEMNVSQSDFMLRLMPILLSPDVAVVSNANVVCATARGADVEQIKPDWLLGRSDQVIVHLTLVCLTHHPLYRLCVCLCVGVWVCGCVCLVLAGRSKMVLEFR